MNTEGNKMWYFRPDGQVVLSIITNYYSAKRLANCYCICHLETTLLRKSWNCRAVSLSSFPDKMVPSVTESNITEHINSIYLWRGVSMVSVKGNITTSSHWYSLNTLVSMWIKSSHWTSKSWVSKGLRWGSTPKITEETKLPQSWI